MLSIQYPLKYKDIFAPHNDFDVWDMSLEPPRAEFENCSKPLWLDYSNCSMCHTASLYVNKSEDVVILPTGDDPSGNLLSYAAWSEQLSPISTMGIWSGDKVFLSILPKAVTYIALPWKVQRASMNMRSLHIEPEMAAMYHAYEFCNLDELRRFPWASLHTSVPITAAIMGIDLSRRERRPKVLPPFSYELYMTTEQIDLALKNISAIKEAMKYARCYYAAHTR